MWFRCKKALWNLKHCWATGTQIKQINKGQEGGGREGAFREGEGVGRAECRERRAQLRCMQLHLHTVYAPNAVLARCTREVSRPTKLMGRMREGIWDPATMSTSNYCTRSWKSCFWVPALPFTQQVFKRGLGFITCKIQVILSKC